MITKPREQQRRDAGLISDVVRFWKQAGNEGRWFDKDKSFDDEFRERFLHLHMEVAKRRRDNWIATPEGALTLLILTDPLARNYAWQAQAVGHMERVEPDLRLFFCLPFAHSEEIADQEVSVLLNAKLGEPWLSHAQGHRDIIQRFGRFPHRNPLLGRETATEEVSFLREGGFRE
ncbi:DUF924 family protein [Brucella intermedia]|uniref:DUF924 family protein n=1 Tax=Brucella intermedia TaxID=94625 RepID=UPI00235FA315|nr:DUF924 family protein [Brucella intermedia]